MKKLLTQFVLLLSIIFRVFAQENTWTSGRFSSFLDVDANRPANSASEGFNIGRNYNTNIQLATKTWGGNHVIFFNAYKSGSMVPGSLITTGNSKFANSTTSYGSGAGAISFVGNGGVLGFYISDVSTGENTNVVWGYPKLSIQRNGNVGIGTSSPLHKLDIAGNLGLVGSINQSGKATQMDINPYERIRLGRSTNNSSFRVEIHYGNNTYNPRIVLNPKGSSYMNGGNLGIGTTSPDYKLDVLGTIRAKEVKVATGWSDFVLEPDYDLKSLSQVQEFINENGHLPDIPSAEEVEENGICLGEMDAKLLQKIEELTLYVIELKKEVEILKESR